jgi:hypothetical protein
MWPVQVRSLEVEFFEDNVSFTHRWEISKVRGDERVMAGVP